MERNNSKRKRVYISADYSEIDGDRNVIDVLHSWGNDNIHIVDYVDTAEVVSGSVTDDQDCRPCDLKAEFNRQIDASSYVLFVIGDKTSIRSAGSSCRRIAEGEYCPCTPYKQNFNGQSICRIYGETFTPSINEDLGNINEFSYIEHEFRQALKRKKKIIVTYNSLNKQPSWLPSYMKSYESEAQPFWIRNPFGKKMGNYDFIKSSLGYE